MGRGGHVMNGVTDASFPWLSWTWQLRLQSRGPRVVHRHPLQTGRAAPFAENQKRRCPRCPTLSPIQGASQRVREVHPVQISLKRNAGALSTAPSCLLGEVRVPSQEKTGGLPCRKLYLSPHVKDRKDQCESLPLKSISRTKPR